LTARGVEFVIVGAYALATSDVYALEHGDERDE